MPLFYVKRIFFQKNIHVLIGRVLRNKVKGINRLCVSVCLCVVGSFCVSESVCVCVCVREGI